MNGLLATNEEVLKALTQQYPYFTAGHILYAKKMHHKQSPFFEEALSAAAVHTIDRERLYSIMEKTPLVQIDEQVFEKSGKAIASESVEQQTQENSISAKEIPLIEMVPYEMEMLREIAGMDEVQIDLRQSTEIVPDTLGLMTFTGWLTAIQGNYSVRIVERKEANKPIIVQKKNTTESEVKLESGFNEDDARQLAARSIVMGDNVITETFALVLAIQGKTQKAIEVYEMLCLKYPEKKPYFAAKIEELRK